MPIKDIYQGK